MSIEEKRQRIQPKNSKLSIQRQCELIGLPRSIYYRKGLTGQETPTNLEFMRLIDNEYTAHPFYGTRQIRNALRRNGYKINRKRVQRLMRKGAFPFSRFEKSLSLRTKNVIVSVR